MQCRQASLWKRTTAAAPGSIGAFHIYGPPQTKELVDAAFHFITVGFRPFDPRQAGRSCSPTREEVPKMPYQILTPFTGA